MKLFCLFLLLALFCPSWTKKQSCDRSASTCDECIKSGPECAWCTAPGMKFRCHNSKGLRRMGCRKSHVYDPQGEVEVVRDDRSTEALFIQPQEVNLRLRPDVSQTFLLTVTAPPDQAVPELTTDASSVSEGVNVTFTTLENPHHVQVTVVAAQCGSDHTKTGPWSVHITPRGSSLSVKLEITLECQCKCTGQREENSGACSGHGALVCGRCACHAPYLGQQCQSVTSQHDDYCRPSPEALVCSGRGLCMEGFCECEMRQNPQETYSGRYCECSNFDCPRVNDQMCGGRGTCDCSRCNCDEMWTGADCGCSMETAACMATNGQLCRGRGACQCGQCICEPPFTGPTCESCPTCENTCVQHAECVECRGFGTGRKKDRCDEECAHINVTTVATKDDLPEHELCKMRSGDDHCFFFYTLSHTASGTQSSVARSKDCPRQPRM